MSAQEIAAQHQAQKIQDIARNLGLDPEEIEPYGHYKAKIPLSAAKASSGGKLILVSAISPTPAGEGKTTTSIGLHDGLRRLGKKSLAVLREPSLGPVFGMKGGATGGGYAQVLPMEEINLHFTGDFAAIEKANNLLSAMIDNHLHHRKSPLLDPRQVLWKRVMDMNDRALRQITVGLGGKTNGMPREDGFNITAASEVMAILCMARDREDLVERLGGILVGFSYEQEPVYARDIKAEGAMAALLKEALKPNLVQTLEGNPVLLHGGPFANIAQGTNSIIATKMALQLADYVVTEAGFGFDLGGEKFIDLKCRQGGFQPSALVMVATVRALKYHGGQARADLAQANPEALRRGLENLEAHLDNAARFGLQTVVAINRFAEDSEEELAILAQAGASRGVEVVLCEAWAKGGAGAEALAQATLKALERQKEEDFQFLFPHDLPVAEKIERLATELYGAEGVDFSALAQKQLRQLAALGLDRLPVCMAKTEKSLSDNPLALGRPRGFRFAVRELEIAAGAGFVVPLAGTMMRMPGLPKIPAAEHIRWGEEGISGLF